MADKSNSSSNQGSNNDQTQSQSTHTSNSDSDPFGLDKYIKPVSDPWSVYNMTYSSSSASSGSTLAKDLIFLPFSRLVLVILSLHLPLLSLSPPCPRMGHLNPGPRLGSRAGRPPWPLREFNAFKLPARTHQDEAGGDSLTSSPHLVPGPASAWPSSCRMFKEECRYCGSASRKAHAQRVMTSGLDSPKRHREIQQQPQPAVSGKCETCQ
ncbi:hypothetical protein TESG_03011 [Trichophyton tonsurans CBS 112818]|uniref:Uncharacterized protein n=1 Tax=Trichophyton tonsurans (strain CBS 112818) TaxID=647933 RepID=F2RW36_TRIT1|nr:hypothetical protein TESG_03011 [Trichophyton tonsurans CBS 112818]